MVHKILTKCKEHKWICVLAAAILLLAIAGGIVCFVLTGSGPWISGGADTKGPFRYQIRRNGKIEVRIDTTNLPDGQLVLEELDSEEITTEDQGMDEKEHVFLIRSKLTGYKDWIVSLYADDEAQKQGNPIYEMRLLVGPNEKGRPSVLSDQATDLAPVTYVESDGMEYDYRTIEDGNALQIRIYTLLYKDWYISCDDSLFRADDFYYTEEYAYTNIHTITSDSVKKEICLYTLKEGEKKKHADEIVLQVKTKDGIYTEVKKKEKK